MSLLNMPYASLPGMGTVTSSTEVNFLASASGRFDTIQVEVLSSAVDGGSTPTTTLRAGLLLGRITATGLYKQYDNTATDGSQIAKGALQFDLNMLDQFAAAQSRVAPMVINGTVYQDQIWGLDEYARRQLHSRFRFLDRLEGVPSGTLEVLAKTANYQVVNGTDNCKIFTNQGAAGEVDFTLPATIQKGNSFTFFCEVGQILKVIAPANKLVCFNNATATSVALQTGGNEIGSGFRIEVNADGSKYLAMPIGAGTVTVA